ncbi:uncharacterized protein PAC_03541 [Phialocephala subalpina]|uniref:Uncharacterized protein n=1 Tax=Phialocephala subalpina TaxID=576137 RepID=A0A1L7WLL1_9HELO|nr:uncharacterized protein PAC_03541 [Phialocephala subalpina]
MVFSKDPWVQYGRRRWKWAYVYDILRKAIGPKQFDPISSDSSSTIPIGVIDRVPTYASEHLNLCFERITEMENTRQRHHKYEAKGTELIKLVSARRGLRVTDPRDMIFAHTGFASDGNAEVLHVDYTKQWEKVLYRFGGREVIQDDEILPELEERSPDESFRRVAYGESKGPFPVFGFTDERNNDWGSAVLWNLPTRDSIADCLVASFDPQFERSFLEGRRLARFSNGVLALVPASVQLGDVVMCTDHGLGSWSREPFLLRPCPQLQDSSVDAMIKTKVLADIEASTDSGDIWRHDIEVATTP